MSWCEVSFSERSYGFGEWFWQAKISVGARGNVLISCSRAVWETGSRVDQSMGLRSPRRTRYHATLSISCTKDILHVRSLDQPALRLPARDDTAPHLKLHMRLELSYCATEENLEYQLACNSTRVTTGLTGLVMSTEAHPNYWTYQNVSKSMK